MSLGGWVIYCHFLFSVSHPFNLWLTQSSLCDCTYYCGGTIASYPQTLIICHAGVNHILFPWVHCWRVTRSKGNQRVWSFSSTACSKQYSMCWLDQTHKFLCSQLQPTIYSEIWNAFLQCSFFFFFFDLQFFLFNFFVLFCSFQINHTTHYI